MAALYNIKSQAAQDCKHRSDISDDFHSEKNSEHGFWPSFITENAITLFGVVHSALVLVHCDAHHILSDRATEFIGTGRSISKMPLH